MKIIVTGTPMEVLDREEKPLTDPDEMAKFDGIVFDATSLADYFDVAGPQAVLREAITGGGFMKLVFNAEKESLQIETEFEASRGLTDDEVEMLIDYTRGQWSDGVGSGFNSYCGDNYDLFVDGYCSRDTIEVQQVE